MPAERYYISQDIIPHHVIELNDKEFHHMTRVMRSSEGDVVELINGKGILAYAKIKKIEKHKALLEIENVTLKEKSSFRVIIVQAIPRMNRLDFILEKGTELGMTELWLFPGRHSERQQLTQQQINHMEGIVISATKQCGRLYIPEIHVLEPLKTWSQLILPAFYGDVSPAAPSFVKVWQENKPQNGVLFFIGPEAGFHPDEEAKLQRLGAKGVKLHDNILRTDTASLTALSIIALA